MSYQPATPFTLMNWLHISPLLIYFLISPLYLFYSGMPQFADGALFIGILIMIIGGLASTRFYLPRLYFIGIAFAAYTVVINLLNYTYYPHTRFLLSSLYYPYNILAFIYVVSLIKTYGVRLYQPVYIVIILSILWEFLWAVTMPQQHWRETGSFNNPNQLAYWGLLSAAILVLLKQNKSFNLMDFIALILIALLQALALSKAGLITYCLFLGLLFFTPLAVKTKRFYYVFSAVAIIAIGFIAFNYNTLVADFVSEPIERVTSIGAEADDNPEARGYLRPIENPFYLVLGAGEGAYDRFATGVAAELHSGIATIIFSYGIVGAILFLSLLYLVIKGKPFHIVLLLGTVLLFGITSQAFRFSHFWIFLAFLYFAPSIGVLKNAKKSAYSSN